MTPARRWRRAAAGIVVGLDVVLLVLGAAAIPGFTPYALPVLAGATVWGLLRPGGWGALALVLAQVLTVTVPRAAPESVTDWAVAAVAAAAVLLTHLVLALLAAFPPGAALPGATLRRWGRQAGLLATLGGVAAGVGVSAPRPLRRGGRGCSPRHSSSSPRRPPWSGSGPAGAEAARRPRGSDGGVPRDGVRRNACAVRACGHPRRRAGRWSG